MERNNIILIGMPASGKSTVGVILAKILGYSFIDADLVIQERYGKLLKDIIAERGVDGFIKAENDVLESIEADNTVIATGGSAVYGSGAIKHLKESGRIVYLKLSYEELSKRLSDIKGRGVVLRDGQTLRDLYDERIPLYEKYADLTVDEAGRDIETTVKLISQRI